MRLFLNAGHHEAAPGAQAPGVVEHPLARKIVYGIARTIRNLEPVIIPQGSLGSEIEFVNRWARPGDLALDVHLNSFTSEEPHGVEAFHAGSGKGAQFARELVEAIVELGRADRGIKLATQSQHSKLAWVAETKLPWACLLEIEFISNPGARHWLVEQRGWERSAVAIARRLDAWP